MLVLRIGAGVYVCGGVILSASSRLFAACLVFYAMLFDYLIYIEILTFSCACTGYPLRCSSPVKMYHKLKSL